MLPPKPPRRLGFGYVHRNDPCPMCIKLVSEFWGYEGQQSPMVCSDCFVLIFDRHSCRPKPFPFVHGPNGVWKNNDIRNLILGVRPQPPPPEEPRQLTAEETELEKFGLLK